MTTYESDRDAAAWKCVNELAEINPKLSHWLDDDVTEAFKAGADWGYERGANAELKEWRESMRKHHFDEISQKLEAAKAEIQRLEILVRVHKDAQLRTYDGLAQKADKYDEAAALIAVMAEALKQYADKARWSARKIPLGNGQSASAPGLFFGPNIAIEALAAHAEWSVK